MTTSASGNLDWLLDDLVTRLVGVHYAVLLSTDGLLLARSTSIDRDNAERFSAMSSTLQSLARSAGSHFGVGRARQTVIELDHAFLFVTAAGDNACIALLAAETAHMGMIAYEMNQAVQSVGTHMSVDKRSGELHRVDPKRP
ncbi:roadblock/LC7 domain-containing protein [Nocardia sp. CA-135398]|uniref:roadblock/LC7 domain-containing protein n=1 Tax=Nocardia sp. CA-135398 TaxID=3239977 RepID=UPI003D965A2D